MAEQDSDLRLVLNEGETVLWPGDRELQAYLSGLPPAWRAALEADDPSPDNLAQIWSPVAERARGFVVRLAMLTVGLGLVVSPGTQNLPRLLYVCRKGEALYGWLGGPPSGEDEIRARAMALGLDLPASLRRVLQAHNGFLRNGVGTEGLLPLDRLSQFIEGDDASGPARLLPFWEFGPGARQCYDLRRPAGQGDYLTVYQGPGGPHSPDSQSFWSFLKKLTVLDLL